MRDFTDATVVVSGAAAGLGRALCERFGRAGARIVALDLDASALEHSVARLHAAGIAATAHACDVADEAACRQAIEDGAGGSGGIDLLICNAGISHHGTFAHTRPAVIRRVMAVNFLGAMHCTHAALPALLARRGMIVAISSVAGFAPLLGRTGYAASKHALHGFFDSLRSELAASGVHVMLVCPSFIATDIDRHALDPEGRLFRGTKAVVGKPATPERIADLVYEGARREQRLLLPGATARLAWWLSRLTPAGYARIMAARMRRAP
ncbi:MAG: SDR family oxidoreductase [Burkholderiaceae bacterium]|nr:SDR family oxidoreductase [Burkholderiaceae bacterium]MEB2350668.1 SDR family oxidoreductase [Burkholderiaceae bacterium]